jgi:hypothetical protein
LRQPTVVDTITSSQHRSSRNSVTVHPDSQSVDNQVVEDEKRTSPLSSLQQKFKNAKETITSVKARFHAFKAQNWYIY